MIVLKARENKKVIREKDIKKNKTIKEKNIIRHGKTKSKDKKDRIDMPKKNYDMESNDTENKKDPKENKVPETQESKNIDSDSVPDNNPKESDNNKKDESTGQSDDDKEMSIQDRISKLKSDIEKLSANKDNLQKMYIDSFISRSAYESTKKAIDESMKHDKETISIEREHEVMEGLKKKIDSLIESTLKNHDFSEEDNQVKTDLERAEKLHTYGIIDDSTYKEIKTKILNRMDHGQKMEKEINNVIDQNFERYRASFTDDDEKKETQETQKKDGKDKVASGNQDNEKKEEKPAKDENNTNKGKEGLKDKMLGLLRIRKKKENKELKQDDGISGKLDKIKDIEEKRDAILELMCLLKSEIHEKIGSEDELTYNKLSDKLSGLDADPSLKNELIDFLKTTSESEYNGSLKDDRYSEIYDKVEEFLYRLSKIKTGDVPGPKDDKKKK